MGVKGRKLKHYSGDLKLSAVEEVLTNHMGLRETARKYGVTHKMIQTWIRLYLEKGKDALYRDASKHKNTLTNEIPPAQNTDHKNHKNPVLLSGTIVMFIVNWVISHYSVRATDKAISS